MTQQLENKENLDTEEKNLDASLLPNKKFISKEGYDLCILCKNNTPYQHDILIEERKNYLSGAGQLCETCHNLLSNPKTPYKHGILCLLIYNNANSN